MNPGNSFYHGVKRSKVKVTGTKNSSGVDFCTLVNSGFFLLLSGVFLR